METAELQKRAVEIVDILDKKFSVKRDAQLNLAQLVEEIGELAKDINLKRLRHKDPDRENLEGEFADVFLQLSKQADIAGIDLEKAVLGKTEELKKRHGLQ
jgi:NTP pyrophosphatase (non-canonical NTP hydrolase)